MAKKITSILGAVFLVLIIIQMVPAVWKMVKEETEKFIKPKTKVGSLCINGPIDNIGYYTKYLKKFFEDQHIKAILLRIDSPGGYAGASSALFNEIISLKKDHPKPVVALTVNICASGAYEIACASDYIIAAPGATVGSIGAYIGYFKFKEFIEQWKARYGIQKSGDYKAMLNPFTESTKEEEALIQAVCDDSYNQFKETVAQQRKLSLNSADIWANGKVFTGRQAFAQGLVDAVGSEYDAINKIKDLALIEEDIEWVKPPKPTFWEKLSGTSDDEECVGETFTVSNLFTPLFAWMTMLHVAQQPQLQQLGSPLVAR